MKYVGRQGDILLTEVGILPAEARRVSEGPGIVLAEGRVHPERTHVLKGGEVFEAGGDMYVIAGPAGATVEHPVRGPLHLEAGKAFRVIQQNVTPE